jgi:hypothetical protein
LEERIRKTYGPDAPKRTGAGGEKLPAGLKRGGMVRGKVKGYKDGGQVSRGGSKAIAGIKFRGTK